MQLTARLFAIIFLCFSCYAHSAAIKLKNGDTLNAEIIHINDSKITVKHPVLGHLNIPVEQLSSIVVPTSVTKKPVPESKKPADHLAEMNSGDITLQQEQLTDQNDTLSLEQNLSLTSPNIAKAKASEKVCATEKKPKKTASTEDEAGLFGTPLLAGWKSSINIGFNGAAGSSNNTNFRAGFSTKKENKIKRWDFNMYFLYKQEDNQATDNKFQANLLRDWFITDSNWFYFASGGLDWDQFRDWDYRIRAGGGSGYQYIKTDKVELATRHGLNMTYSIFSERNELQLEALLGLDWNWKISDVQSITFNNTIYPALTDLGQFRNVTNLEWKHKISFYDGLAIKFGFNNEYDSTETNKFDLKYYASLVWGL